MWCELSGDSQGYRTVLHISYGRIPPAEGTRPYEKLPIPTDFAMVRITLLVGGGLLCARLGHQPLGEDPLEGLVHRSVGVCLPGGWVRIVTALEGLHVTGKYRNRSMPGMRPGILTRGQRGVLCERCLKKRRGASSQTLCFDAWLSSAL